MPRTIDRQPKYQKLGASSGVRKGKQPKYQSSNESGVKKVPQSKYRKGE